MEEVKGRSLDIQPRFHLHTKQKIKPGNVFGVKKNVVGLWNPTTLDLGEPLIDESPRPRGRLFVTRRGSVTDLHCGERDRM